MCFVGAKENMQQLRLRIKLFSFVTGATFLYRFALLLIVLFSTSNAHATEFEFSCSGVLGVSQAQAEIVCSEFDQTLRSVYSQHKVIKTRSGKNRLDLRVLKASPRSVSLIVNWIYPDGRKTSGKQLQTSFFDKNANTQSRKRFFVKFLNHNPIPF